LIYDTVAAIEDYKNSPSWLRKLLDACADGLNFYLYTHPKKKPRAIRKFQPWYALLRTDGSIGATQTGGINLRDLRNLYPIKDMGTSMLEDDPVQKYQLDPTGSNGFAVAPSRTASGNSILYINPHTTFYYRPEVHIVSEEGLNAYGAVTWSTFFIYQGFNGSCGWMHTSSYADVADAFEEKVIQKDGIFFYEYDKKLLPVKSDVIPVKYLQNGVLHERKFTVDGFIGTIMVKNQGQWIGSI
jgi:acyl-homoserine lactone acylase PvdQ